MQLESNSQAPSGSTSTSGSASVGSSGRERWIRLLLLLVLPLCLIGPALMPKRLFLPQVATTLAPLASENPGRAQREGAAANFSASDRIFPFLTDQQEIRRQLKQGVLPTWEPNLGLGLPLYGASLVASTYPPNALAVLMPPERAAGPLAILALFLMGLGTWLFLSRLGLANGACIFAALATQISSWGIANLHYPMKVDAALWFPWCLWAIEGLAQRKRGSFLCLALCSGCSFLAGFVTISIFVAAASGLYAIFRLGKRHGDQTPGAGATASVQDAVFESNSIPARLFRIGPALAALLLGVGLASVQLLPNFEASRHSVRQDREHTEILRGALPGGAALGLALPGVFGSARDYYPSGSPTAWWVAGDEPEKTAQANPLEWNTHAGAALLILALVGLVSDPRRARVPLLLLVGVWGFAQGWPALRFAYRLPGFNIGDPVRILALQWTLWPWLAAIGVDSILRQRPRASMTGLAGSVGLGAVSFAIWTTLDPVQWAAELEQGLASRHGVDVFEVRKLISVESAIKAGEGLRQSAAVCAGTCAALFAATIVALLLGRAGRNQSQGPTALKLVIALLFCALLFLGPARERMDALQGFPMSSLALGAGALVLLALARGHLAATARWLPLAFVVVAEGLWLAPEHLAPRRAQQIFPSSPGIEAIARAAGGGRVLRLHQDPSQVIELARPNMLSAYGVQDLTPFTVFTPRTLVEALASIDPAATYRSGISGITQLELVAHPLLDLLNITAILSVVPLDHPRLELVYESARFYVYKRSGAMGPARIVPAAMESKGADSGLKYIAGGAVNPRLATSLSSPTPPAARNFPADNFESGSIEVERPAPNRFNVVVQGGQGGWLVMHEQWYPGWKAKVNGKPVQLLRADHAMRALPLPAGDALVETVYEPGSLRLGLFGSIGALLMTFWLAWRGGRKRTGAHSA